MKTLKSYILILLSLFFGVITLYAQSEKFSNTVSIPIAIGNKSIDFPAYLFGVKKKIKSVNLRVQFDLGEDYNLGKTFSHNMDIKFKLKAYNNNSPLSLFDDKTYSLVISSSTPEAVLYKDLTLSGAISEVAGNQNLSFDRVELIIENLPNTNGMNAAVIAKRRLQMSYEIDLGIDVQSLELMALSNFSPVSINKKIATFSWSDVYPISHFQFQLLRLYNQREDKANLEDEQVINTVIDWSKAMTVDIHPADGLITNKKIMDLTIAEGTGFYVYRIRPISDYYDNGMANSKNWGPWSFHDASGTNISLNNKNSSLKLPYFYFADPDQDKNYIYSRTFTEGNKVKETTTYANSLQQVRQSQTYLPSQDVTIITQTVLDHSGRPSLSTIPVPIDGHETDYKENFFKSAGGSLYQAKDFDTKDNFKSPAQVNTSGAFSYYNGSNPSIPSAEGYPYTRMLFYNEGTSRPSEQSGVGKTHMIGKQTEGQGRTTRNFYSTASESELIRLFGDEAPSSESVIKNITVDPNNIATVTYTSKEGKVIATSLSFWEGEGQNLTDLDEQTKLSLEERKALLVKDRITKNIKTPQGFVSSKRVTLMQTTDLNIGYSVKCEQITELCQKTKIDCDFTLQIIIYKLDEVGNKIATIEVVKDKRLRDINCLKPEGSSIEYKTIAQIKHNLAPGTYIIEKRLIPGKINVQVKDNEESLRAQINPISNTITSWLDLIKTETDLQLFLTSLNDLATAINNKVLDQFTTDNSNKFKVGFDANFITLYNSALAKPTDTETLLKDKYSASLYPSVEAPVGFILNTPCCTINIPVKWIAPIDCVIEDDDGDGEIELSEVPDFEAYAVSFLSDATCPNEENALRYKTTDIKKILYEKYMQGWEQEGVFNLMIYHMLTDKYNAETIDPNKPTPEAKVQYKCEELVNCWINTISRLKDQICETPDFGPESGTPPYKVSEKYDNEHQEDPENTEEHDGHFDNNMGKGLTKFLAERKISKKMRGLNLNGPQGDPMYFNVATTFLDCSGYQFAKIITPLEADPLPEDKENGFTYSNFDGNTSHAPVPFVLQYRGYNAGNFNSTAVKTPDNFPYIPFNNWGPREDPNDNNSPLLLPNIKNPIYAFKYFEYTSVLKNPAIEAASCFYDPNNCFSINSNGFLVLDEEGKKVKTPQCCDVNCVTDPETNKEVVNEFCGIGRIRCPYTHESWSSGQRMSFYSMVKSLTPDAEVYNNDNSKTCNDMQKLDNWYSTNAGSTADLNGTINRADFLALPFESRSEYTQVTIDRGEQKGINSFSYIEMQLFLRNKNCTEGCEKRRDEIRKEIIAMLTSKCYLIGACKVGTAGSQNQVPEEDIDDMVEAIVGLCLSQCQMQTYSCQQIDCRKSDTPLILQNTNISEVKLQFGLGGHPNPGVEYADGQCTDDIIITGIQVKSCPNTPIDGKKYSWYEYTKGEQASSWDFEISLPTKCTDVNGNLIAESPFCSPATVPNTPVGDTFMPRERYEVNKNVPGDPAQLLKENEPVQSDPVSIKLFTN